MGAELGSRIGLFFSGEAGSNPGFYGDEAGSHFIYLISEFSQTIFSLSLR